MRSDKRTSRYVMAGAFLTTLLAAVGTVADAVKFEPF